MTARYPKVDELLTQGKKYCPQCQAVKLLADFYASTQTKSGRAGRCKVCDGRERSNRRKTPKGRAQKKAAYRAAKAKRPERMALEKFCNKCEEIKPANCFEYDPQRADAMRSTCRPCFAAGSRERQRRYKERRRAANPERFRLIQRGQGYTRRYGLEVSDFERMNRLQKGRCAICGASPDPRKRFLDIDHDHQTGQVRELLCTNCNTGLGRFQDDSAILERAKQYLLKHRQLKLVV